MTSSINLAEILVVNLMGLTILFAVFIGNIWRIQEENHGNNLLRLVLLGCFINCVSDPICFLADGKPGLLSRVLVYGGNTAFYFGGLFIGYLWILYVSKKIKVKLHPLHKGIVDVLFYGINAALIVNLFVPIFFSVDEYNVYSRIDGYWFYMVCSVLFMLDGLVIYLRARMLSGGLRLFPVWAFIIPAAIGMAIQITCYGLSAATPFVAVSVVCLILCLQNQFMYVDMLTGLYNRYYLNIINKRLQRDPSLSFSAIMLDINGFKKINDRFGHKKGDEALVHLASILTEAVGNVGALLRYAGDEFFIILNTQDEAFIQSVNTRIDELLDKFNQKGVTPYQLSVAKGYSVINIKEFSIDEYVDKIDSLMYDNKEKYYQSIGVHARDRGNRG